MSIEAQGTIKVKNLNGELVPFMPKTDIRSIKDRETSSTLVQRISGINDEIGRRTSESPIKVMYETPTEVNTESFRNISLIGAVVPVSSDKKIFFEASISEPANGEFYVFGETIKITYDLFNASDANVTGAKIKPGDRTSVKDIKLDIAEAKHVVYEGTIKEADITWCINNNDLESIASVMSFTGSSSYTFLGNSTVKLNCIPTTNSFYDPSLNLSITSSSDGNNLGNTIKNTFTYKNTSKGPFAGSVSITASDNYGNEYVSTEKTIDVGKEKSVSVEVTITEDDILHHQDWDFEILAEATSFLGKPCRHHYTWSLNIASPNPKLKVQYQVLNSPAGLLWTDGESVTYKIVVTNVGNLTLSGISITDQNSNVVSTFETLAPKEKVEIENEAFVFSIPAGNQNGTLSCTAAISASAPESLEATIQTIPLSLLTDKYDGFQYTVGSSITVTSAPFFTDDEETTITVDWGDGTTSTFDCTTTDTTHTYSSSGTYTVSLLSSDWSKTYLDTRAGSATISNAPNIYWFRNTLVSLNIMLPKLENTSLAYAFYGCTYLSSICNGFFCNCDSVSSFSRCFNGCTALRNIPADLFSCCTSAVDFSYCFYECGNLSAIPGTILDNCSAVTNAAYMFYGCSKVTAIPEGLFADCSGILNFHCIFKGCTNIQTIPEDLFKYSTLATDLGGIFWSCTHLQSIPEDLLRYNVAATNVGAFFCSAGGPALSNFPVNFLKYNVNVTTLTTDNWGFFEDASISTFSLRIGSPNITNVNYFSSATGTVYVPAGSTTKTTFVNYGSSRLTIVEE